MNNRFVEYFIGGILVAIFGLIVLHAPIIIYFGTIFPDISLVIKSWKEILMIVAGLVLMAELTRRRLWSEISRDKLFWILLAFFGLHLLLFSISLSSLAAYFAGMAIDLRFILFFALCYVFLGIYPNWRRYFLYTAVIGALVVLTFGSLQLFLPRDFLVILGYSKDTIAPYGTVDRNYDFVRIISTMRGPNPLGAYAAGAISIAVAYILSRSKRNFNSKSSLLAFWIIFTSMVCLWFSYSRSALAAALVGLLLVSVVVFGEKISRKHWAIVGILIVFFASILLLFRDSYFVSNVLMHEDPGESGAIDSNQAHVDSLHDGLRRMFAQPLGAGVGSTGSASLLGDKALIIENQYLFVAHEAGWLGWVLFLSINTIILYRLYQYKNSWWAKGLFSSGVALACIGLLLPVWADDTVSVIWWGLAAVILSGKVRYGKTN